MTHEPRIDEIEDRQMQELLGELHALVAEAEAWARRERIEEPEAVARCRAALAAEGWPTVAR